MLVIALTLLWAKAIKAAKKLFTITIFLILLITLVPIGDWALLPLEKRFLPQKTLPAHVDGIIMLAGPEDIYNSVLWKQVELYTAAERYLAFIQLTRQYPDSKHVFTGGTGSLNRQEYKSTLVAEQLFKNLGVDTRRMIYESESKNTYENALFSFKKIQPQSGENWILVTSASHMPRAVGVFRKVDWQVIAYPVDHNTHESTQMRLTLNFSGNLKQLKNALHEWTGLAAYYITGKTNRLFPGP